MKSLAFLGILIAAVIIQQVHGHPLGDGWYEEFLKSTADRIREHEYPTEEHQVETADNYVITLFRMPYSHKLQNQEKHRPVVFLQHGLTSSSDGWILSGPDDSLPFLLVDAGYDVWLGNARGNRYSRNNTRLSPNHPYFWRFSWHEIGVIDIPTVIDYILDVTDEDGLHYVGHSQGTTVFFVMTSSRPEYNDKIKTAHLLAPVAFMSHMATPLAKYTRRFVGRPNQLTRLFDTMEVLPSTMFYVNLYNIFCKPFDKLAFMCTNMYYMLNGDSGVNTNKTVAAHMNETHPAGASSTQALHYMQEYESGRFCQLDHGERKNMEIYGQPSPPDYDVHQIRNRNLHFYYSDNDDLSDVIDVEHLASLLPNKPQMFHVPDPQWTHGDFVSAMQVKEMINDPILAAIDAYESS